MALFNFLRFRKRVPEKGPPPKNFVDVSFDAESGKMVARDSDDNPVLFDAAAGAVTSADITDATYDPQSEGAFEKAVLYSGGGSLTTTELRVVNGNVQFAISAYGLSTSNRDYLAPDADGTLGVLRSYSDSTAANAAVSVGDAWWDTTLKKVRVRLT